MKHHFLTVMTLWRREIVRFARQRSRVTGAFAQPLVFWILLGGGLRASFQPPGMPAGMSSVEYFYPGIIALMLLFTAIFSTISVVEDRQAGFLQGVLVAPVSRAAVVLGQALGSTTLAMLQGLLFLILAPIAGVPLTPASALAALATMLIMAFSLSNLGLTIAWRMTSTQGFHAIMNLLLLPLWLLSGAFFPATGAPWWIAWIMTVDPLTYGIALLRRAFYLANPAAAGQLPPAAISLGITLLFCLATAAAAVGSARRGTVR